MFLRQTTVPNITLTESNFNRLIIFILLFWIDKCKLSKDRDLTVTGLFLEAMIIYHTTIYFTGTISYGLALGSTYHHQGQ